ncbi:MAG: DUF4340 domain-containing protein [Hyphomonadaceae bacterium]|nr:DUF4340 domain-containing protein [Hyphomonadaceae bacterium]
MSNAIGERRQRRVLTLFLVAGALIAVAAVTTAIENRMLRSDTAGGPVVAGLESTIHNAERIQVTSAEASYRIERIERGAESVWVMRDRGDYPVNAARLAQFTQGIQALRYTRRMSSDPGNHERLGVGDPRQGGGGVLVQIEDGRGAQLVNLILGVEPGGLYVRRPDQDQTFAAEGELPPLRDVAAWLDLQPMTLAPERLARIEIMPAEGRAYVLARGAAEQPWRVVSPPLGAVSPTLVSATAERLASVSPVDVQTAPAIQGTPNARVRASTFDGVIIDAEIIRVSDRAWLKLVARPAAPEHELAALDVNNRVSSWAYALDQREADALAPPLATITAGP